MGAIQYVDGRLAEFDAVAAQLKCRPADVSSRVAALAADKAELEKKLAAALTGGGASALSDALAQAQDMGAYKLVIARLEGLDGKQIRNAWDTVRDKMGDACAEAWGCDLTHAYVDINADYRS
jgi:alanyl-tRNA synthetase